MKVNQLRLSHTNLSHHRWRSTDWFLEIFLKLSTKIMLLLFLVFITETRLMI